MAAFGPQDVHLHGHFHDGSEITTFSLSFLGLLAAPPCGEIIMCPPTPHPPLGLWRGNCVCMPLRGMGATNVGGVE